MFAVSTLSITTASPYSYEPQEFRTLRTCSQSLFQSQQRVLNRNRTLYMGSVAPSSICDARNNFEADGNKQCFVYKSQPCSRVHGWLICKADCILDADAICMSQAKISVMRQKLLPTQACCNRYFIATWGYNRYWRTMVGKGWHATAWQSLQMNIILPHVWAEGKYIFFIYILYI